MTGKPILKPSGIILDEAHISMRLWRGALIVVRLLVRGIPLQCSRPHSTVADIVVVRDWKTIHPGCTGWLVLSSFLDIPLRLLL